MRNCQICGANGKRVILNDYHDFKGLCLFECTACGHRYIDGLKLSQAWFDNYYLTQYVTDDKPYSDARLNSLAYIICMFDIKSHINNILDIGGMDGELKQRLDKFIVCDVSGVGDKPNGLDYGGVILSHTLEHIYDVNAMFQRIESVTRDRGFLFIEIPIHLTYQDPQAYDLHWQHINKFRPQDIEALLMRKGYTIELSEQIADYREYNVWRIVGRA